MPRKTMQRKVLVLLCTGLIFTSCISVNGNKGVGNNFPLSSSSHAGIEEAQDGLMLLPAGSYTSADGTVKKVKSFYLSPYEVTQEEWKHLMRVNPSAFNGSELMSTVPSEDQNLRPVEMISWFDAVEFCNKKSLDQDLEPFYEISGSGKNRIVTRNFLANGYRLPTSTEWEYAALSAGEKNEKFAGTNTDEGSLGLNAFAWYRDNSDFCTHQVGLKLSNKAFLFDMSGNVYEWCDDEGSLGPMTHIWKGGSAQSESDDCAINKSPAYWPDTRNSFTGMRLARNAK